MTVRDFIMGDRRVGGRFAGELAGHCVDGMMVSGVYFEDPRPYRWDGIFIQLEGEVWFTLAELFDCKVVPLSPAAARTRARASSRAQKC